MLCVYMSYLALYFLYPMSYVYMYPGHLLVVTAVNITASNVYVSKAVVNGREINLKQPFLQHSGVLCLVNETMIITHRQLN